MRDFRIVLLVVALYFGVAYFAAYALIPRYAYEVGLASLIIGLSAYQSLLTTIGEDQASHIHYYWDYHLCALLPGQYGR